MPCGWPILKTSHPIIVVSETMTTDVDEQTIPKLAPTFRLQWEEAQNCHVLLYPEGMVKLSNSASEILKRCDGNKNIADIISDLNIQYPGADLENDVKMFFKQALDNGWIKY